MSDLAKALAAAQPRPSNIPTTLARILSKMEREDKAAHRELLKALDDEERVSNRQLSDLLTIAGYPCGNTTIQRHRSRRRLEREQAK